LKQGGVRVRYVKPVHEPVPAVVGVASVAPARGIGFEYQVFPSSDETTVAQLGKLKEADFGWPKAKPGVVFEPVVRGVLGNIAYAIYERHFLAEKGTRKEAMRLQLATQRVLRSWTTHSLNRSRTEIRTRTLSRRLPDAVRGRRRSALVPAKIAR
jgi:hypothetical protein